MLWSNRRYVQFLEQERSRLLKEIEALKRYNGQLIDRLLQRSGIPSIVAPDEPSPKALEKMLSSAALFEDVDDIDSDDKLTDNRKDKYDEFVS